MTKDSLFLVCWLFVSYLGPRCYEVIAGPTYVTTQQREKEEVGIFLMGKSFLETLTYFTLLFGWIRLHAHSRTNINRDDWDDQSSFEAGDIPFPNKIISASQQVAVALLWISHPRCHILVSVLMTTIHGHLSTCVIAAFTSVNSWITASLSFGGT